MTQYTKTEENIRNARHLLSPNQIKRLVDNGLSTTLEGDDYLDYLYSRGYYSKSEFMKIFLSHRMEDPATWRFTDEGRIHREIDNAYEESEDMVLILPRWHAKTTRTLVNILHDLVYRDRQNIGYLSSWDLGKESVGKLRIEIETNEILKAVFWDLAPIDHNSSKVRKLKKWKQSLLQFNNGNSIETLTMGQKIRGRRKTKRVIDDPNEDSDSKESKIKQQSFIMKTVYNTMLPWGNMVVLGTVVGDDCLVLYLRDEKKRRTIQYKAIENWEPVRPEMRSLKALEERKKALGSKIFDQEFMHVPMSREDAVIQLDRCRRHNGIDIPKKWDRLVLTVDPAKTEKQRSDFTGLVFWGIANNKFYILRSKQIKLSPLKLEKYVEAVAWRLRPDYIIKEDNIELGMTESLADKGYNIIGITVSKDKRSRLVDASPEVENGNVFFREEGDEELIKQLTNYPAVAHDDLMDAFTLFINYWSSVSNNDLYIVKR